MGNAIFYKEWAKTRKIFFCSLILSMAVAAYAVLMMNRLITLKGVEHLWIIMLLKDNMFVDIIKYVPLVIGMALGAAQMVPEMQHRRLKLTLHLPYPQNRMVTAMLSIGLGELALIFAVQLAVLAAYDFTILPYELVGRVVLTTMPWYFAGFVSYLFVTAICLEASWRMRVLLALIGTGVLMMFFLQQAPEAYNGILLLMVVFIGVLVFLSLGSVIRFKEGRQN